MSRTVCWFSCGAASAVATRLVLDENPDAIIARCVIGSEHPDNDRFARDCAKWFGKEIVELRSEKYPDTWAVWEQRRFLVGPKGALCTTELKKKVRQRFELPDDVQVFGLTWDEDHRAKRFREQNPEITARFPLIERRWSKSRCFFEVERAGLVLPAVYRPPLSLHNANCIPCVKGGAAYFNRIRRFFPAEFERLAKLEDEIGATVLDKPLRELRPDEGRDDFTDMPECGLFCGENGARAREDGR